MILTGPEIEDQVEKRNIIIEPFDPKNLNPNSYDFRLGGCLKTYKEKYLDANRLNETTTIKIPQSGILLQPDTLYLGHTSEKIGSNSYVPIIKGKSSIGRIGLFIYITADLVDIGYLGQFTLMMHSVQPVKIYPNMRIGQVTFWKVEGDINLYSGKYQNSQGPNASQSYKDFEVIQ